jgi:hypothetical protein
MNEYKGQERRRAQRKVLVTFCPAIFTYKNKPFEAMMVNLTPLGAGFLLRGAKQELTLKGELELSYEIKTPYGNSPCTIRTKWVRKTDEGYAWGGEFTQLSEKKDDPLRCLTESPF